MNLDDVKKIKENLKSVVDQLEDLVNNQDSKTSFNVAEQLQDQLGNLDTIRDKILTYTQSVIDKAETKVELETEANIQSTMIEDESDMDKTRWEALKLEHPVFQIDKAFFLDFEGKPITFELLSNEITNADFADIVSRYINIPLSEIKAIEYRYAYQPDYMYTSFENFGDSSRKLENVFYIVRPRFVDYKIQVEGNNNNSTDFLYINITTPMEEVRYRLALKNDEELYFNGEVLTNLTPYEIAMKVGNKPIRIVSKNIGG